MCMYRVIQNFYLNVSVLFLTSFPVRKPILFPQVVIFTWVSKNMATLLGPMADFTYSLQNDTPQPQSAILSTVYTVRT
jgi:hypothetical protein